MIKSAILNKDVETLSILRVLKGEIERNEQTSKGKIDLSDSDIINIVKKLAQGVKDTNGSVTELTVLESFLPKQLSEAELTSLVSDFVQANSVSLKDMGHIMSYFKSNYGGQYDGKLLSEIVKRLLIV